MKSIDQSQKQISKQSYQELQIIMKSIYLQYSRNLSDNIKRPSFYIK